MYFILAIFHIEKLRRIACVGLFEILIEGNKIYLIDMCRNINIIHIKCT